MFQSMGSSATFNLPPDWFSYNFVGFALCAVVGFRDHHDDGGGFQVFCECKLKTEDGLCRVAVGHLTGWSDGYRGPRYIGSDHVFLGFDFYMFSDGFDEYYYSDEVFIQFYLEDCCEVTKCGIHLLYAQDFSDSTEDSVWNFSSDEQGELPLQPPPPPKRLKYSVSQSPVVPFVRESFYRSPFAQHSKVYDFSELNIFVAPWLKLLLDMCAVAFCNLGEQNLNATAFRFQFLS